MELETALSRQKSEPAVAVAATDMEMATECVRSNETRRHSDKAVTMMHSAAAIIKSAPSLDAKPLNGQNLHHLAVLKKHLFLRQFHGRASTGSIADLTVAAASSTANKSAGKEDQRYEKMMERFQVRRLQSSSAVGATDSHKVSMRDLRRGSGSIVLQQRQIGAQRASGSKPTSSIAESTERPTTLSSPKYNRMSGSLLETRVTVVDLSTTINRHSNSVNTAIADEEVAQMSTFQKLYHESLSSRWVFIAWKRKLRRKFRLGIQQLKEPMSPLSLTFRIRVTLVAAAFGAHVIAFPIKFAFVGEDRLWTHWVDSGVEVAFLVEFFLMFNTSFLNNRNDLITSRRKIFSNYIRGWGIPDLLSSIPKHFIQELFYRDGSDPSSWSSILFDIVLHIGRFVHLPKIFRMLSIVRPNRTGKSVWDWLLYSRHSHLLRIGFVISFIVLIAHYMACAWTILTSDVTDQDNEEAYAIYASNFYDALHLLQGQGVATATLDRNVFASCAVLAGSIVLAIIFGHVAVLVSNFNANSTNYQHKMESVFAIMTKMQLPAPLRERIHQYYEHLWREYESLDGEIGRFSKDLSHTLELEVMLFKYIELIMHIPFWKECTPGFQKQLILNLHVRVYLPDDFIIRRGEVDDEFYMINHGSCKLASSRESVEHATAPIEKKRNTSAVSDFQDFVGTSVHPIPTTREDECDSDSESDDEGDTKLRKPRAKRSIYRTENFDDDATNPLKSARASKFLKKLSRGQAFGEMALLMNYQRTANVRTITYVEMCMLNRSDFHRILSRYPDDRKRVTLHIVTNCMGKNESSQVHCPFKEVVVSVYGGGADSAPITAKFAAEMIARTVNPDLEDDSIKFGITTKLTEQLIELREREAKRTIELRATTDASVVGNEMSLSHPVLNSDPSANTTDNATATQISPSLLARIELIEDTQEQVLRCINEINGITSEIKNARAATDKGIS
ncbi:Voltage-gated ion channel, partial [Globisporangium splendens]